MSGDLRRAYEDDPETVRAAGRELAAIGMLLAEGRVEEAETRALAAEAGYAEWAELDRAAADLYEAATARAREEAARDAVVGIVAAVLRAAVKGAIGL